MSKLIFNADDFGLSYGVNQGILESYQQGVVNSISLMTNMPAFDDAVEIIKQHQLHNIGLHVNLTEGKSLLNTHSTITDFEGNFYSDLLNFKYPYPGEIYDEIKAQYQKAVDAGIHISHIDSHLHLHTHYNFQESFLQFSKEKKIPIRKINFYWKYFSLKSLYLLQCVAFFQAKFHFKYYTKGFTSDFFGKNVNKAFLLKLIRKYKHRNIEVMCHPGYSDLANGEYNQERELELELLCDPEVVALLKSK